MSVMTNNPEDKARELQRALYRAAKRNTTRRFHALFDKIIREDILRKAWQLVRANRGSTGVDHQTIQAIEGSGLEAFLHQIQQELREGTYRPLPVRRVNIPKPDGRMRPLGIPAVRDRVVQAAVKIVIEPIFEADFKPSSFGFRPKRSAHDAVEIIRRTTNRGYDWVVDADIENYFCTIDQKKLMAMVAKRISDRQMLKLIWKFLSAGVLEEGVVRKETTGTPQGGVISPLLANLYLNELDTLWEKHCGHTGVLVRYADDAVILCRYEGNAKEALRRLHIVMERLGLKLHPSKTRLVNLKEGREGFDFLGFHQRKIRSWKYRRLFYLQQWPNVRAMRSIREKMRAILKPRSAGLRSLQDIIAEINPILRGWGNYFAVGNSARKFNLMTSYVQERLYLFLSKKHKKSGRGWKTRWQQIDFRKEGLHHLTGTVRWPKHAVQAAG